MKVNSLFSKYILFILGIISLMPGMAYSQTFKHYEGVANKTGDYEVIDASTDCLRQKTHVVHYYIALPSGGSKELSLPFPAIRAMVQIWNLEDISDGIITILIKLLISWRYILIFQKQAEEHDRCSSYK